MKKTLDEKYEYNKKRIGESDFSRGYCFGIQLYRDYSQMNNEGKKTIKGIIDSEKKLSRYSDMQRSKGFMCGIRDAANERKARKGK